jgi:hypothetical protein
VIAVGVAITLAAVALFGNLAWRSWHAAMEMDRVRAAGEPVTPQDLAALYRVPTGVPDATEAWRKPIATLQAGVLGKYPFGLKIMDNSGRLDPPGNPWPEFERANRFVAKQAALYAEVDAAIAAPGECAFLTNFNEGYMGLLDHAQQVRNIVRLLVLRAYVRQEERDAKEAAENLQGVFRASAILKREPLLVSQLIRMACNQMGVEALENLLPSVSWNDAQLAQMQALLLSVGYQEGFLRALMGERVLGLIAFDNPTTAGATNVPGPLYQVWVRDDPLNHLTVMREMIEAANTDWPKPLTMTEKYAGRSDDEADVRAPLGGGRWEVPSAVVGRIRHLIECNARETARLRCAAVGVAAVRFRRSEGNWPQSFDELVPKWLDTAPLDPCNGQPLLIKSNSEGARVYSVGVDRRDDGGVETPKMLDNQFYYRQGEPDVVFTVRERPAAK